MRKLHPRFKISLQNNGSEINHLATMRAGVFFLFFFFSWQTNAPAIFSHCSKNVPITIANFYFHFPTARNYFFYLSKRNYRRENFILFLFEFVIRKNTLCAISRKATDKSRKRLIGRNIGRRASRPCFSDTSSP